MKLLVLNPVVVYINLNAGCFTDGYFSVSTADVMCRFVQQGGAVFGDYQPASVSYVAYVDQHSKKGRRECRSYSVRGKQICQSLGGVFYTENPDNGAIYTMP